MNSQTENIKNKSVEQLFSCIIGNDETAYYVSQFIKRNPSFPTKDDLMKINGVGEKTAERILSVMELQTRYFTGTEIDAVKNPEDVVRRLSFIKYEPQEKMIVITLDSANHVIGTHEVTKGLVNQTPVHPREVFRHAVADNAVSVIVAHNHPSGCNTPSPEDYTITKVLISAGKILQIPLIDHIVISKTGFTSICREGKIEF